LAQLAPVFLPITVGTFHHFSKKYEQEAISRNLRRQSPDIVNKKAGVLVTKGTKPNKNLAVRIIKEKYDKPGSVAANNTPVRSSGKVV
jgi:hypothetical protein